MNVNYRIHLTKSKFARAAAIAALIFILIITQTGCGSQSNDPVSDSGFYLDTYCEITIYNMGDDEASDIIDGAFDKIEEYESLMSKTIEGSDVWNVNHADGEAVEVSEETYTAVKDGVEMGELSGGVFDITVGQHTVFY